MNLRYLYNHHKNTVTIQAELMGYLPAENALHSWSTRKPRPSEIDVVSEKPLSRTTPPPSMPTSRASTPPMPTSATKPTTACR